MKNSSDIIIIGAGILGLATAYTLLKNNTGLSVRLIEKENNIALHQTGHNSGVIHSGIYYKPGSLKALNCRKGYEMLLGFCRDNSIPFEICGKIIIANGENELKPLETLYERGISNGLTGIKYISSGEIKEIEPYASGIKGIHVPETGIVDYKEVSKKLFELSAGMNLKHSFGEEVCDIKVSGSGAEVFTRKNMFSSKAVIACAGLHSDRLARFTRSDVNVRIIPFRGEYYKLRHDKKYLVKNLIYPVPDPAFPFLGVHFTRGMNGEVEAGPNAVLALKREGYKRTNLNVRDFSETLAWKGFHHVFKKYWKTGFYEFYRSVSKNEFVRSLRKLVPSVTRNDLVKGGAGVRAQACDRNGNLIDDFVIAEDKNIVNVLNAPSPAATSCLSIGETLCTKILSKI